MQKRNILILMVFVIIILALSINLGGNISSLNSESEKGKDADNESIEGISIQCDEGNSGTVQIPMAGINVLEIHEKHHWDMPTDMKKIVSILKWSDNSWELKFSIGLGDCPDNGEEIVSDQSNGGLIMLIYEAEQLSEEQWFAHVETPDPENHRGGSCDYEIEITIFQCSCEH